MTVTTDSQNKQWITICKSDDLVNDSGICALINNTEQVAIFKLPNSNEQVFAIGNYDPIGKANVISRGIVGCIGGEPVVASPLYKQQFSLRTGRCLQEDNITLITFPVRIEQADVQVFI